MLDPVLPDAFCAVHASVPADSTCARCGAFACWPCLHLHEHAFLCTACYQRLQTAAPRHSQLGVASLGLGAIGVLSGFGAGSCGIAVAGPAILVGAIELARIRSGAVSDQSSWPARAGIGLGVAGALVSAAVGLH